MSTCNPCPVGTFAPNSGMSTCIPCPVGTFAPSSGMPRCTANDCPAGKYLNSPASQDQVCDDCAAGRYQADIGKSSCTGINCAAGKFGPTGQTTASAATCDGCPTGRKGFGTGASACVSCDSWPTPSGPEYFQDQTGQTECRKCALPRYSGGSRGPCEQCPSGRKVVLGTYRSFMNTIKYGTGCQNCSVGKYRVRSWWPTSECQTCTSGQYQDQAGQSMCRSCPPGFIGDVSATQCVCETPCDPGEYKNLTTRNCTACDAGRFNPNYGDTSPINTTGMACRACPIGRWSDQRGQKSIDGCRLCKRGKYSDEVGSNTSSSCRNCTIGTYQDKEGMPSCKRGDCSKGKYGKAPKEGGATVTPRCANCSQGRFNPARGLTRAEDCLACPIGHYGTVIGSVSFDNCTNCASGQFQELAGKSGCEPCEAGKVAPSDGVAVCLSCLPGKFSGENRTSCQTCPAGKIREESDGVSESSCEPCALGQYQDEAGKAACKPGNCPRGKFGASGVSAAGATSISNCTACPKGRYNAAVGAADADACEACPAGRWGNATNATTFDVCKPCRAGYFGNQNGLSESTCSGQCPAGKYSLAGFVECLLCPKGEKKSATELDCSPCSPGQYAEQGETGAAACALCPEGRYQDSNGSVSCVPCPSGTYSDETGLASSGACKQLPAGMFSSVAGLTTKDGGAVRLCPAGKFSTQQQMSTEQACISCASNEFTDLAGESACSKCKAGFVSSTDRTQCEIDPVTLVAVFATLAALLVPTIILIRRHLRHRRKYAIVKLGNRQCFVHQWRLSFPRRSRFSRLDIAEGAKLGNGAFGEVNQGTLQVGKAALRIAVKHVMQSKATEAQRKDTIVECRLHCELESPFVVKCFGFATGPGPGDFSILLELMDLGDLLTYMMRRTKTGNRIAEATRLQWMIEAASALEYVHASGLIHADVAARNLCVCHQNDRIVTKLTDFGMSKKVDPALKCYLLPRGQPVPLWWSAPECLPVQGNFVPLPSTSTLLRRRQATATTDALQLTQANDVWSFGITMWEIEAHAALPSLQRPFASIKSGRRALDTLYNELLANKANALAFDFRGGGFSSMQGSAFDDPSRIAHSSCLHLRPSKRLDMAGVRRLLQACALCDASSWSQGKIHQWLHRMGVPEGNKEVLESDLFALSSFADVEKELGDDNYRADYVDPAVHPSFTPALSSRIAVEIRGIQSLANFQGRDDWPDGTIAGDHDRFDWMTAYQGTSAARSARDRNHHRRGVAAHASANSLSLHALYASGEDGASLYTSGDSAVAVEGEGKTQHLSAITGKREKLHVVGEGAVGEEKGGIELREVQQVRVPLRGAQDGAKGADEIRLDFTSTVNPLCGGGGGGGDKQGNSAGTTLPARSNSKWQVAPDGGGEEKW